GRYALPGYLCYGPGVASSLTLGFGGSAGSEGPIAYTGAAIGSNVARLFRMDSHITMILLGCGAGAGIAGIFKAPIGGFLFTLEVLRMELTTMSVVACLLACVASAMTAYMLSGFTVDLTYIQELPMEPRLLPVLALLGIVCGLYSLYYGYIMRRMQQFYESIPRAWVRNLVSGLVLAALLFLFPALYGEGYGLMRHILQGDIAALSADGFFASATAGGSIALVAAGILAVKAFACSASNSGGGVAGDFAPTLYAGCVLGFLFATVAGLLWPDSPLPVAGFAFCGMAGVMSGVLQAPLMALFLTAEMTDANVLFLPLLIVSAISFGIIRLFRPAIYYTTV
ncbi:MAG: chloride channel protein, partial [Terasakiella sp.]|nr:chloride channel protein [Terasakiella sp.]